MFEQLRIDTNRLREKVDRFTELVESGNPDYQIPREDLQELKSLAGFVEEGLEKTQPKEDIWEEDPDYPRFDWRGEINSSSTLMGYWEWVTHRKAEGYEEPT